MRFLSLMCALILFAPPTSQASNWTCEELIEECTSNHPCYYENGAWHQGAVDDAGTSDNWTSYESTTFAVGILALVLMPCYTTCVNNICGYLAYEDCCESCCGWAQDGGRKNQTKEITELKTSLNNFSTSSRTVEARLEGLSQRVSDLERELSTRGGSSGEFFQRGEGDIENPYSVTLSSSGSSFAPENLMGSPGSPRSRLSSSSSGSREGRSGKGKEIPRSSIGPSKDK